MLESLHIRNIALIDQLTLRFGESLNILTGETGAGKSVVIDAINLILGGRAAADLIRSGEESALVEALFRMDSQPKVAAALEEAGLAPESDGTLLIAREVARSGRSQCRLNGRLATLSVLKAVGESLVDVHGQHEHQSLLAVDRHVEIFDNWCGGEVAALKGRVADLYRSVRALERQLARLESDERERARRLDLYAFQIQEIDQAKLSPGEEADLAADRIRLANAEKLYAASGSACEALSGGENVEVSALDALNAALMHVADLSGIDPALKPVLETMQAALYQAEDVARELRQYREGVEFNPERLEEVESRLDLLRTLKRKYGDTIEQVLAYRQEIEGEFRQLSNAEEIALDLKGRIEAGRRALDRLAADLSRLRAGKAPAFEALVVRELHDLAMKETRFQVSFASKEADATGADRVEFLIAPNPGEPLKPLARIVSGGEMSRVMLALKSIVARSDQVPTLIFDEIDVGIGGLTAQAIAEKLAALGGRAQILCVTHLPQIASRANTHFSIEKAVQGRRTLIRVLPLGPEERVREIARMLGGLTGTALDHAREMLEATPERRP
ncbi:MAG: DNA repair protein RecN [Armatimonadetes bacterium]|nr:DNA repair protein RecN [Armatimonadota bacterium]